MSDDFIREVDEEFRREQIALLWKKYSNIIYSAIMVIVLVVGGYSYWEHYKRKTMTDFSSRFSMAIALYQQDKIQEADAILEKLMNEADSGYKILSQLRLAISYAKKEPAKALAIYDTISGNEKNDRKWRDLADLRAAKLRIDSEEAEKAIASLNVMVSRNSAWRHSARELLFAYAVEKQDYAQAEKLVEDMSSDADLPYTMRALIEGYRALAQGGAVGTSQP